MSICLVIFFLLIFCLHKDIYASGYSSTSSLKLIYSGTTIAAQNISSLWIDSLGQFYLSDKDRDQFYLSKSINTTTILLSKYILSSNIQLTNVKTSIGDKQGNIYATNGNEIIKSIISFNNLNNISSI